MGMGSDVETGRIPGAKSVWQAHPGAGSKEQAAGGWRHIFTTVWSDGWSIDTVQAGFPRYFLYCITHERVLGVLHLCHLVRSIPSAHLQSDRSTSQCGPFDSTRRPLPASRMTRWQAPRDDYLLCTRSLEKQAPSPAKHCKGSRDDGLAGVSLEGADIGVPSKPAWARPGQARSHQPPEASLVTPQCGMRPQPQPQPLLCPAGQTNPVGPTGRSGREKKGADEVVLREGGRAGVGHVLSGFEEDVFHSRRLIPSYCTARAVLALGLARRPVGLEPATPFPHSSACSRPERDIGALCDI